MKKKTFKQVAASVIYWIFNVLNIIAPTLAIFGILDVIVSIESVEPTSEFYSAVMVISVIYSIVALLVKNIIQIIRRK